MPAGTARSSTTTMRSRSRHSPSGSCRAHRASPARATPACSTTSISRSPAPIPICRTSTAAGSLRSMRIAARPTASRSRNSPPRNRTKSSPRSKAARRPASPGRRAQAFFNTVRTHTMEGMFADPVYGGNKDFAGWVLVGFPGAQPLFSPADHAEQGRVRGRAHHRPAGSVQNRDPEDMSHGNRKNRCRHRWRRRGGRHSRGRTRQSRHEGHRARARPAPEALQDFNPHDELRYFQRQDLRPNSSASPSPGGRTRMRARPRCRVLNYGNQAGGGTVHYGAVSWRMHEDDFRARSQTIERYGASAIPDRLLARRLAVELRRSRALLRPRRIRARRVGQGRQSAGQEDRRRQRVRSAAPSRISAAAVAVEDQAERPFDAAGAASSAITRSRPRAPSSRSPIRAGRAAPIAASARPSAVMSARSRRSSSPSCPRPTPPAISSSSPEPCAIASTATTAAGDRRLLLRPRRLRQHDRGRDRHRDDVHLRQHPSAAAVEDARSSPTVSPIRAATSAST